ncbi:ATP-binding protein, partial [Streptomyces sp. NPDC058045]|uniref:ATP-binding protein n=1 Tax=Streptomyces sp. NPDC058045 TaxID=3346311 RepID=UPI0036EC8CC4
MENRSVSPVFVGRDEELDVLGTALDRAGAGVPQAVLVGGEAGVGKTRLTEEFTARARRAGAVTATGGCIEIGADGLPFAPFSAALRALRRLLPEETAAAVAGQEGELARLLPELGDPAPGCCDEDGTARLFGLTARLLERLAADRPLVLVLEDLHWSDASTRHLLGYLLRTLRTGRLLVLATYRTDDVHRRHPLRPLLAELERLRTPDLIALRRFHREEVGRQIAGILARVPDPAQVDAVFERSDGNAFFVEELAVADSGAPVLSDSLRDLLLVRVERLPERARHLVRTVAEGGSTVEYPLLAAVCPLGEDELLEALRAAVGAAVLLADGAGYRFRHSLVREAVSDDLLPGERARLNRRYATALEADPGLVSADTRTTRLAGYWYHAGDAAKALPAVLRASVEARRRHAYAEQLGLLERAMELWDAAPRQVRAALRPLDYVELYPVPAADGTPLQYLDLMAEAAVAGRLSGDRDRALTLTRRALRLLDGDSGDGTRRGDPYRAAWFWVQRSRLVRSLARGDGRPELTEAQRLVRGLPPSAVHAEVLAAAANWSMRHEPGHASLTAAERAVEYARMVGARPVELTARLTLGGLMVDAGQTEAGLAEMRAVLAACARADAGTALLGRCYLDLPSVLEGIGRSREAAALLAEGRTEVRRRGLLEAEGRIEGSLADSLYSLGRWDEAAEAAAQAMAARHHAGPRGQGALGAARLALARGDTAEAARHLATAHRHRGHRDAAPQHLLPPAGVTVGVAAAEGRILDARAEFARVAGRGFPPGSRRHAWPLLLAAATAETAARALP